MRDLIKRHSVLLCLLMSVILLMIATSLYPGGSVFDTNSIGFDWTRNFMSNLFDAKALNGADNPGWIWAVMGMAFHAVGDGLFFIHTATKIPSRHAALVLRTTGTINIVCSVAITTRLHDIMVALSSTLFLLALFYITVFIFKSKLQLFKVACVICLLTFYYTLYLYGADILGQLAIMQKVSFIGSMLLVLAMEYCTNKEDFAHIQL